MTEIYALSKQMPHDLWGKSQIKVSGALISPDQAASVPLSSCLLTTERMHTEPQSTKSLEDIYLAVDYTPAMRKVFETGGKRQAFENKKKRRTAWEKQ